MVATEIRRDAAGRARHPVTNRLISEEQAQAIASGNVTIADVETRGFEPIVAYNILAPYETVIVDDNPDPQLRRKIKFYAGVYYCQSQNEVDVLKGKAGVYFEDFPKGMAGVVCPKKGCGFTARNHAAMHAHIASHLD